jgi:hypothetical protein
MSTNFQVLEIQEDLAIAQAAELRMRVAYRQAAVNTWSRSAACSTQGVALADDAQADEPHTYWSGADWLKYSNYRESARPGAE